MFHVSATDALMRVFIDAIEPSNILEYISGSYNEQTDTSLVDFTSNRKKRQCAVVCCDKKQKRPQKSWTTSRSFRFVDYAQW